MTDDAPYSLASALREHGAGTAWRTRDQLQRLAADAAERGDTEAAELNTTMLDKVTKLIGEIDPGNTLETP